MLSFRPLFALAAVALCASCGPPHARPESPQACDGGNVKECRSQCQSNVARACYRLGWFHEHGEEGVSQSMKRAVKLYDQACSGKMAVACRALGIIYQQGADDVGKNKRRSREYFQKACDLGLTEVCPPPEKERQASGGEPSGPASGGLSVDVKVGGGE